MSRDGGARDQSRQRCETSDEHKRIAKQRASDESSETVAQVGSGGLVAAVEAVGKVGW